MFPANLFMPIWLSLTHSLTSSSGLSIQTTVGTVNGFIDETTAAGVVQYRGIPFAEPPVNSRRWLPPIPKTYAGKTIIDGTKFGLSCPQYNAAGQSVYAIDAPQFSITPNRTSEDCLSLNIWAPAKREDGEGEKLPVIVWIYGGGFQTGGGDIEYQIPVNWVQRSQKHIVVGINYRLNIFGFPNAAGLDSSEQNLGLLDQRLGIEWVRDNIANFGGDVTRIALWGQSAGSQSVDYYNYAYAQDPIVSSLIMDSGVSFLSLAPPTNTSFPAVAAHFKCPTDPVEQLTCLRQIPQTDIVAYLAADPNYGTAAQLSFNPVVDNRTRFANYTTQTLEKKFAAGLPAIIGTNTNEAIAFVSYPKDPATTGPNQTEANAGTLASFLCPADETTKLRYQVGATTYRYLYAGNFSNVSPRSWMGAYHSSEVPLIMGTSGQFRGNNTAFESSVSAKMQDLWLAFISDPKGGLEKQDWKAYTPDGNALVFGNQDLVVGTIGVAELEAPCNGLVGKMGASSPLAPSA